MSPNIDSDCQSTTRDKRGSVEECQWKFPNGRLSVIIALSWALMLLMIVLLSLKIICLSTQMEEQKHQLQTLKFLVDKRLPLLDSDEKIQGTKIGKHVNITLPSKSWSIDATQKANEKTEYMDHRSKRMKRSSSRQRNRGPCHLEAIAGPGSYNPIGEPLQIPESEARTVLWKRPDAEPPSKCLMRYVEGRYGIEHIRISKNGFYYVYAQVTYRVHPWKRAGHRVILKKNQTDQGKTLMQAIAPERGFVAPTPEQRDRLNDLASSDSRYTGGIFYLYDGDLLGVYPLERDQTLETSDEKSYFGIIFHG